VALLWKMICNLGDPMILRHPVSVFNRNSVLKVSSTSWDTHYQFSIKTRDPTLKKGKAAGEPQE